jgi:hypothetical protein
MVYWLRNILSLYYTLMFRSTMQCNNLVLYQKQKDIMTETILQKILEHYWISRLSLYRWICQYNITIFKNSITNNVFSKTFIVPGDKLPLESIVIRRIWLCCCRSGMRILMSRKECPMRSCVKLMCHLLFARQDVLRYNQNKGMQ